MTFIIAGSGVILTIRNAMNKRYGLTKEEASSRFYIVDKDGLISKHRPTLSQMEEEFYDLSSFAVPDAEMEGKSLLETVKMVKPNIIIGKQKPRY